MKKIKTKSYAAVAGKSTAAEEAEALYVLPTPGALIPSDMDLLRLIRKGVNGKTLEKTMQLTQFTSDEMAGMLHISVRTLRRYDTKTILDPEQSERVLELQGLYQIGREVFGSLDRFREWVNTAVLALGHQKPKAFMDTSVGIQMVKDLLGRIQYGVYS